MDVFGGKSALEKNSPICAGRYNSTKANEASVCFFRWDLVDQTQIVVSVSTSHLKISKFDKIISENDDTTFFRA